MTLPAIMGDYWLLDLLDDLISNSSVGQILGGDVATILSCNVNIATYLELLSQLKIQTKLGLSTLRVY